MPSESNAWGMPVPNRVAFQMFPATFNPTILGISRLPELDWPYDLFDQPLMGNNENELRWFRNGS